MKTKKLLVSTATAMTYVITVKVRTKAKKVGKRKIRLFHLLIKEYQNWRGYLTLKVIFIFEAMPKWEWQNPS